ncbi:MAG: Ni/Fe hydrogenase subunit alpha [Bdellovibrio sp.]|nr:MAG: Ni/Fe hydrogenase subunit alpha [Bdellovibrio sp.]
MSREIIIDPVTRVEGHGRVTLLLDEKNHIQEARLHIVEFRGFERFVQGRPYWEAPVLVQRLCGICPVSHHLCAAKAVDEIVGMRDETIPQTARLMRRLMHYGQVLQSHALHFFYLAAPDLLLGIDSEVELRNVVGLAQAHPELAKKGILLRKFGQEIIRATAGKRIHGISAVPGGIHKNLTPEERDYFQDGKEVPSINEVIAWCEETLAFYVDYHLRHRSWVDEFLVQPMPSLSLVGRDGELELYHGPLRCTSAVGYRILDDVDYHDYLEFYGEEVKPWTYLKFPFIRSLGFPEGSVRVGPLARLNTCDFIATPRAQRALEDFRSVNGRFPQQTLNAHWARLIEMLHCAEKIQQLLADPQLQGAELKKTGEFAGEGIGFLEAPRGTLVHHYQAVPSGEITRCNLIVSTTHNNLAMNEAVRRVSDRIFSYPRSKQGDPLLNAIEVAIRAYDPCLSCATHALGKMPLAVQVMREGELVAEYRRGEGGDLGDPVS